MHLEQFRASVEILFICVSELRKYVEILKDIRLDGQPIKWFLFCKQFRA